MPRIEANTDPTEAEPEVQLHEDHTVPADVDVSGNVVGGSETIEATVDGNAPAPETETSEMAVDDAEVGDDLGPDGVDNAEVDDSEITNKENVVDEIPKKPSRSFNKKPIHVDALGLFFGSATKPDWDTTLFHETEGNDSRP